MRGLGFDKSVRLYNIFLANKFFLVWMRNETSVQKWNKILLNNWCIIGFILFFLLPWTLSRLICCSIYNALLSYVVQAKICVIPEYHPSLGPLHQAVQLLKDSNNIRLGGSGWEERLWGLRLTTYRSIWGIYISKIWAVILRYFNHSWRG